MLYISIIRAFFLADISYFFAVLQKSGFLTYVRTKVLVSKDIPKVSAVCYNTDGATQTVGGRFLAPQWLTSGTNHALRVRFVGHCHIRLIQTVTPLRLLLESIRKGALLMELYDFLSFVFLVTISIVALKANFQDICSAVTPSDMVCLYAASCDGLIKEARCTYVLTPYRNLANRSTPSA